MENIEDKFDQLCSAIRENSKDMEKIQSLIGELGKDINMLKDGFSPLHWAVRMERTDIVRLLLEVKDINLELPNKYNTTALMNAIKWDHNIEIVKLLLDKGANAKMQINGDTALYYATINGNIDYINTLLELGDLSNSDINAQTEDTEYTALIFAAENGCLDVVKALIRADAKVDIASKCDNTALIVAAKNGHLDVVKALIQAGAKVDIASQYDHTALIVAAKNGHLDVVEALIQADAKVDIASKYGNTALIVAAKNGHLDVVEALIRADAKVDIASKCGNTALIVAAKNGHLDVVKALIQADAEVDIASKCGNTALIVAAENGHLDVVKALIQADAKVDIASKCGNTALIVATENGHLDVVKALIQADAKVDIQDNTGYTALHSAIYGASNTDIDVIKSIEKAVKLNVEEHIRNVEHVTADADIEKETFNVEIYSNRYSASCTEKIVLQLDHNTKILKAPALDLATIHSDIYGAFHEDIGVIEDIEKAVKLNVGEHIRYVKHVTADADIEKETFNVKIYSSKYSASYTEKIVLQCNHKRSSKQYTKIVEALLEAGTDLDISNNENNTALDLATLWSKRSCRYTGTVSLMKDLISKRECNKSVEPIASEDLEQSIVQAKRPTSLATEVSSSASVNTTDSNQEQVRRAQHNKKSLDFLDLCFIC